MLYGAESGGVDPHSLPGTTCFQDKLAGRCNSLSNIPNTYFKSLLGLD